MHLRRQSVSPRLRLLGSRPVAGGQGGVVAKLRTFWRELKRRNVLRAGVLYAAAAWLLVQVATQVFPFFRISEWVVRWIVVAVVIGAPFWLVFAWFYELTPEGLKRETEIESHESIARRTGRKLDYAIIAVLSIVVVLLVTNQFVLHRDATSTANVVDAKALAAELEKVPEKSIAVLPLANETGDPKQQYFSDGLSEDFINALSQFAGLKVISRNSAFQFRNTKDDAKTIGVKLGVAHLLEGSVRRDGDTVRISAELVNTGDGSMLWSQHYDRPYKDLFALQDEITRAVASELRAKLMASGAMATQNDRPPNGNLDAYAAYLQGKFHESRNTKQDQYAAIERYKKALQIDTRYAMADARLSNALTVLGSQYLAGAQQQQAYARARTAAASAMAMEPGLAQAHVAHGYLLLNADLDWAGAEAEYLRALQLAPHDASATFQLGNLQAVLGHPQSGIELIRQALRSDPLHASWYLWLATYLTSLDRLDEAAAAIHKAIELQPAAVSYHEQLAIIEIQRGDAHAALAAAQQEPHGVWQDVALALALQIAPDRAAADAAIHRLVDLYADDAPYQIAQVHALRHDPDQLFRWLDRAWAKRDPGIQYLLTDPMILRYKDDPRFAAFCRKVGLPLPGEAVPTMSRSAARAHL